MRDPRKAVSRMSGWQCWGAKAGPVLNDILDRFPEVITMAERIGKDKSPEQTEAAHALLAQVGEAAAKQLAITTGKPDSWMAQGPTGWRHALLDAICQATGDPDKEISKWFAGNTPLGINKPIPNAGVFPKASPTQAQRESAEFLAKLGDRVEVDQNYASFRQYRQESAIELQRLVKEGHLEVIGSWQDVQARWPDARATKIATLVKTKEDGTTKTRFIVDMLRSGINALSTVEERIVLPRGSDLIRDVLDVQQYAGQACELFTADITDAFLNLTVAEEERGHVVIKMADGQYAAYKGVPFGLAAAPLLWGRTAALLGRCTQATHSPHSHRLQVYVNDPVVVVAGSQMERSRLIARTLVLWAALGARIALHKAARGTSVKWIGAQYTIVPGGIKVAIDAERIAKLESVVEKGLEAKGLIKNARSTAGELSWVASIIPTIRPFVNMLWAAVYAMDRQNTSDQHTGRNRLRPDGSVFAKAVHLPFSWLRQFLKGHHGGLQRVRLLADRWTSPNWTLRTDASTTGFGGILLDAFGQPQRWWAAPLPAKLLDHLQVQAGEPGLMTIYELLALLVSLDVWRPYLQGCRLGLVAQLDNESALRVAVKLASPHPKLNRLAAELALQLELLGAEAVTGHHWRNILNIEADALSRLGEGKAVPARLAPLPRDQVDEGRLFLLPPVGAAACLHL